MFNRSRRNLARWFTLSMGSILIVFAGVLYFAEARKEMYLFDQGLYELSQLMIAGVENGIYENQRQVSLDQVPVLGDEALPISTRLRFARWYTPEKQLLQFAGPIPPEQLQGKSGFQMIKQNAKTLPDIDGDEWLRQLTLPVYQDGVLIGYLQMAASLAPVQATLWQLKVFLVVGVPVALGVIAFTGWWLGGRAMLPIREAYEQLERFTADASHELRAPLAAIVNNAEFSLFPPIDSEQQHQSLEKILVSARSMSVLISHLLLLARHQGRLPVARLQPTDLVGLLQDLVADYQTQATAKKLDLIGEFPQSPVILKLEPELLRQAVGNLLSNACRYTPEGGKIRLKFWQSSHGAVIEVKDTGIGIAAADLPHIFERFYRADKARSRQTGGFGLGLAITQQIIQVHGGQINVISHPGQGTTFQINLPCHT